MKRTYGEKVDWLILAIAISNVIIHLLVYDNLEYHRDELLYFSLGLHPDFGYATVPPLIGWLASLMKIFFGYSLFAVKLFPSLLGGAIVLLSVRLAKELGGSGYAQVITGIGVIIMPVSLRAFHLFQPVPLDMFFWTLLIYYFVRYINTDENKYLMFFGAVSGLALLNKYLVALLLLSMIIGLIATNNKRIFKKADLYKGAGIGLLIFLPNIFWQLAKGLPVINHMNALSANQLANVNRFDILTDQLLMSFVSSILLVLGFIQLIRSKKYRLFAITSIVVLAVLLMLRGKSYYSIGLFPLLVAAGSVALEKMVKMKLARIAIPGILLLLTLPILPFGIPIYGQKELVDYYKDLENDYGLLLGRTFEDGTVHSLPQDYADQLGWEELTVITKRAYDLIPDKNKGIIYCENYGQAGAIAVIGKKYDLPEPLCFQESFVYWLPEKFNPDIEYFIYINDELGDDIDELFKNVEIIGSVSNEHAREYGTTVYLCSYPNSSFNAFWKNIIENLTDDQMF